MTIVNVAYIIMLCSVFIADNNYLYYEAATKYFRNLSVRRIRSWP